MTHQKNKRVTVKSVPADSSNQTIQEKVFDELVNTLVTVLVTSTKKKFTKKTLRDASAIVLKASSEQTSLHSARKKMKTGTSRRQASKPLNDLDLELTVKNVNRLLRKQFKNKFQSPIKIGLDLTETCYYGKFSSDEKIVRGGKQKNGTRRFHTFATAYVIVKGKRFTLAIIHVPKGKNMQTVVRELLTLVLKTGGMVEMLLLDKGFYSVDVIRLLKRLNISFIMPLKGKRLKKKKKNYSTLYTVRTNSGGVSRQETVRAYSVMKYYDGKRSRTKGVRQLTFISFGVNLRPKMVAETYRKRFGIESSYKLSNRKRARTSSRNAGYRAFLFAVSFFIQNAWVEVKRQCCKRVRKWSPQFISLQDFTNVILSVIREAYGELTNLVFPT